MSVPHVGVATRVLMLFVPVVWSLLTALLFSRVGQWCLGCVLVAVAVCGWTLHRMPKPQRKRLRVRLHDSMRRHAHRLRTQIGVMIVADVSYFVGTHFNLTALQNSLCAEPTDGCIVAECVALVARLLLMLVGWLVSVRVPVLRASDGVRTGTLVAVSVVVVLTMLLEGPRAFGLFELCWHYERLMSPHLSVSSRQIVQKRVIRKVIRMATEEGHAFQNLWVTVTSMGTWLEFCWTDGIKVVDRPRWLRSKTTTGPAKEHPTTFPPVVHVFAAPLRKRPRQRSRSRSRKWASVRRGVP